MNATITISHDTLEVTIESERGSWLRHRMMGLRKALTREVATGHAQYTKREWGHRVASQSFVRESGRPGVIGSAGRAYRYLSSKGMQVTLVAA
jgi:hypothetical protein